MNFQDLHELLRLDLLRRIEAGRTTGAAMARLTGFQQAHISNFLSGRRALSLEGLDRLLAAQGLTIEQLLPLNLAASGAQTSTEMEEIPLVSAETAAGSAQISAAATLETIQLPAASLQNYRSRPIPSRIAWRRFVALRLDPQQAAPLQPLFHEGTVLVLDRHFTASTAYRPHQHNLFAVRSQQSLLFGYVELRPGFLVLRPHAREYPVEVFRLSSHENLADHIVGRVCISFSEF